MLVQREPFRLVLGADHHTVAAGSSDVVSDGGSQIERRNPVGGADLDDPPSIDGPAELVAKLGFITVEREEFIAQKCLGSSGLIFRGSIRSPIVVLAYRLGLRVAFLMELRQQPLQGWIMEDTHRSTSFFWVATTAAKAPARAEGDMAAESHKTGDDVGEVRAQNEPIIEIAARRLVAAIGNRL